MLPMKTIPEPFYRGKVRDLYEVDEKSMLIVSTDRISAFDVVFPDAVPGKGEILNHVSMLWFDALRNSGLQEKLQFKDHVITSNHLKFPEPFTANDTFKNRSVLVKKTHRVDFECVVRGYLAGSGFKEYTNAKTVCGHQLPEGLRLSDKLPEPIFTPATKAPDGEHDLNVSVEYMKNHAGTELTKRLETISIEIFNYASAILEKEGILLCDTKFEFGLDEDNIVLIDEVLTPDSSRYWSKKDYVPGENQAGYDKQFIRDYVEELGWNKKPPAPHLPEEVIKKTIRLYSEIEKKITDALT